MKDIILKTQLEIPSKKNAWRFYRGRMVQTAQDEIDDLIWDLKSQKDRETLDQDLGIDITIFSGDRKDLANQVGTICDVVEAAGIVKNDRQFKQIYSRKIQVKSVKGTNSKFCIIRIHETNTTDTKKEN